MQIFRYFAERVALKAGSEQPVYSAAQNAALAEWRKLLARVSHEDILNLSPAVRKAARVRTLPKGQDAADVLGSNAPGAYAFASEDLFLRGTTIHMFEQAMRNRARALLTMSHELLHAFQYQQMQGKGLWGGVKHFGDSVLNLQTKRQTNDLFDELLHLQARRSVRFQRRLRWLKISRNSMERGRLKSSAADRMVQEKLKTAPDKVLLTLRELLAGEVQACQASRDFVRLQGLKLQHRDYAEDVANQRIYQRLWELADQECNGRGL
ncbi:MAG TPA: hypothetical protein V6C99_08250 [Oculatellaceae cyanobacterium]|jgi:hypothetical protein